MVEYDFHLASGSINLCVEKNESENESHQDESDEFNSLVDVFGIPNNDKKKKLEAFFSEVPRGMHVAL